MTLSIIMMNSSRKNREGGPKDGDAQIAWGELKLDIT